VIRIIAFVVTSWIILLVGVGTVGAQGPYVRPQTSPYARPALSPYLNLLHGGSPAINYYGLVRPQEEFSTSIQGIQNEIHATQSELVNASTSAALPVTGHRTQFFSHGGYFFTHLGSNNRASGTPTPGVVSARPGTPVSWPR